MLYDYKMTLAQMGQIKNYKKENNFEHMLLDIRDIELSTYEVSCQIEYKRTVPLNMFEKYSIRLIERADEIHADMSIKKIAELLHLDENLIRENLHNLRQIGMLSNVESDSITVNKDENAEYLQFENKFKIEEQNEIYHVTNNEYTNIEIFVQNEFERSGENKNKKFQSFMELKKQEALKKASLLSYSDDKFLIFSKSGINHQNDLKFIDKPTIENIKVDKSITPNVLCHYDEFLPLLRDKLSINKEHIVVIGSRNIQKEFLDVFKAHKTDEELFILSQDNAEHKRTFVVGNEDFAWIGDEFYVRQDKFVVVEKESTKKEKIKQQLKDFFLNKIFETEPAYDVEKVQMLDNEINDIQIRLDSLEAKTQKEFNKLINELNTKKSGLYGLNEKNPKVRNDLRKKLDQYEVSGNQAELEKYPVYMKNKDQIFKCKEKIVLLEKQKEDLIQLEQDRQVLHTKKAQLVSKENLKKIVPFEKELKMLERLKI